MAGRINKLRHDENTRAKIKIAHLLRRLHQFFDGEFELSSNQINAAKILLDRALPILQSVEHSGEISSTKVIRAPEVSTGPIAWADEHAPHTEH